ncbi:MAG: hypothetical protein LIR50_06975, partial [Bacillota bacterium]|nr:hypothetical protein [Bacillota bacterium]
YNIYRKKLRKGKIMARYRYFTDEKNRKVIAISTYAGKVVRGIAKADPKDDFDIEKGKVLAKARCDMKVAEKRAKRAQKKINEAQKILDEAREYYERMSSYYSDALTAQTLAQKHAYDLKESM